MEQPNTTPPAVTFFDSLDEVLRHAIAQCPSNASLEEEGGVIFRKDNQFRFERLRNSLTGTPEAKVLWVADQTEFAKFVPLFADNWEMISFHTHPAFPPFPSAKDRTVLFEGFQTNYIWSHATSQLTRTSWEKSLEGREKLVVEFVDIGAIHE